MAQLTRTQLYALVDSKILTGGRRTSGENMRAVVDAIIESLVSATDDDDVNTGYLKIDSSGKVDVTKIKQDTPAGVFLKDNGTWAAPDIINAVLTGFTAGKGNIDATKTILQALQYIWYKMPPVSVETGTTHGDMTAFAPNIANNAAQVSYALPSAAEVGERFKLTGYGAGGWRITQRAGQTINSATGSTTTGTGGYIESTNRYDCVELECAVVGTNFVLVNSSGTITFV